VKATLQLDKYARDAESWWQNARINFDASRVLFTHENSIMLCFPAATLGHHALEALLKAALIRTGCAVFDPMKTRHLDPASGITAAECVWGHSLVELAQKLDLRRTDFDLAASLDITRFGDPMSIQAGLELFDPFFSEMRYPQALDKFESLGPDDIVLLSLLFSEIEPFARP